MKAILFHKHGGLEVLEYEEYPKPEPEAGQVLVKLKAAALNRLDIWVRNGWPGIKLAYPHISGADGAGEIAAVGAGVTHLKAGDQVAIIEGITTAFNGQQRRDGFADALKQHGLEIVSIQSGAWETEKANSIAAALMNEHPQR